MVVEFDRPLARVQNVLLSATSVLHELPEEERFKELSKKLTEALSYCPQGYNQRNIFLFILLNSDADVIDVIAKDNNYWHLINTLPRLSQALILHLIIKLEGLEFLREVITFAPSALAISVMDTIMTAEDLYPPKLGIVKLPLELSKACFHKINISDGEPAIVMEKFFNYFVALQQYGFLWYPKTYPFNIMNEDWKKGMHYIHNIELLSYILQDSFPGHDTCWDEYLMRCVTQFEDYAGKNTKLRTVMDLKWECRSIIVSKVNELTREITVDKWIGLAEFTVTPGKSFQQTIGEGIFLILEQLEKHLNEPRFPDLSAFCEAAVPFAWKPQAEKTECVSFQEIKVKLLCQEDRNAKWMKALLNCDSTWSDQEAIEIIKNNCDLLEEYDVEFILEAILNKLQGRKDTSQEEMLKSLSYQAMKTLPLQSILRIQNRYHTKYGAKNFLCGSEYSAHLLTAFNKLTFESKELADKWQCEVVSLSILDPKAVVLKALEVGIQNLHSAKVISKVLCLVKPMSQPLLYEWFLNIADKCPFNRLEMDAFPEFALELIKQDMLSREKFLRSYVILSVQKAMISRSWNVVCMWLSAMQHVLNEPLYFAGKLGSIAVLLVYIGQVLEYCQQTIEEFQFGALSARDQTFKIIHSLKCLTLVEAEKDWFETYIRKYSCMTLCQLAVFATDQHPAKAIIDYGVCFNTQVKTPEFAAYILVEMLPFLTVKEWNGVAASLKYLFCSHQDCCYSVFQAFQQAIVLLIEACADIDLNVISNHQSCLDYCVRSLGTIMRMEILSGLKIPNYLHVLEEMLYLLSKLPNKIWDGAGMNILPVIVNILQKVPPKLEALNTLSVLITTCPINQSRELLEEKIKIVFKDILDEVRETEMSDR